MACLFLLLVCAGALHLPAQALKPGFDKAKYLELLRPHARMGSLAKPIDGARPAAERRRSLLWPAAQGWGMGGRQARQQKRRQRQQAGYSSKHEWAGKREQGRRVAAIGLTRRINYPKSPLWPDILVVLKKQGLFFISLRLQTQPSASLGRVRGQAIRVYFNYFIALVTSVTTVTIRYWLTSYSKKKLVKSQVRLPSPSRTSPTEETMQPRSGLR